MIDENNDILNGYYKKIFTHFSRLILDLGFFFTEVVTMHSGVGFGIEH